MTKAIWMIAPIKTMMNTGMLSRRYPPARWGQSVYGMAGDPAPGYAAGLPWDPGASWPYCPGPEAPGGWPYCPGPEAPGGWPYCPGPEAPGGWPYCPGPEAPGGWPYCPGPDAPGGWPYCPG